MDFNKNQEEDYKKMLFGATMGLIRGINMDLYSETTEEISKFLNDTHEILSSNYYTNEDLNIILNFIKQGRIIINDLKKGKR